MLEMMGPKNRFLDQKGFTLLEVMIALAIIGMSLSTLYLIVGRSIRATYHARMISQATLLSRYKLAELENRFLVSGFSEGGLSEEKEGSFFDSSEENDHPLSQDPDLRASYQKFRYRYTVDKIVLPDLEKVLEGFTGTSSSGAQSSTAGGLPSGNMMIQQIKQIVEQKMRKVTLRVLWDEPNRKNQVLEVVAFYSDPSTLLLPSSPAGQPTTGAGTPSKGTP